jgi:hypothetical protein
MDLRHSTAMNQELDCPHLFGLVMIWRPDHLPSDIRLSVSARRGIRTKARLGQGSTHRPSVATTRIRWGARPGRAGGQARSCSLAVTRQVNARRSAMRPRRAISPFGEGVNAVVGGVGLGARTGPGCLTRVMSRR